ncbi:MAG: hypothetical protein ACXW1U_19365, partial [Methylobacter sp.]
MKVSYFIKFIPALCLAGCALAPVPPATVNWRIEPVSVYNSGHERGTEIVSVQQSTLRAVLSNFETGEADVLDVSKPEHLRRISRFNMRLGIGEELTSVAFHPKLD